MMCERENWDVIISSSIYINRSNYDVAYNLNESRRLKAPENEVL